MQPEPNQQPQTNQQSETSHCLPTAAFFPSVAADTDQSATKSAAKDDQHNRAESLAGVLLQALNLYYLASTRSLSKLGIRAKVLDQSRYIRSILSLPMDQIYSILSEYSECSGFISGYINKLFPAPIPATSSSTSSLATSSLATSSEMSLDIAGDETTLTSATAEMITTLALPDGLTGESIRLKALLIFESEKNMN